MEKLFELTFQDQTLNPQVGTFTDASQTTGTFTLEDGEYYLTNADTKGFYAYSPVAMQSGLVDDSKVIIEFDLKVVTASVNTHAIIGTYAGVDGNGIPTGDKITLQYNAGDIELVLGSGTTATLIESADVVVDQWYHFRIDCMLAAPLASTYQVKIDGVSVTTVTGAAADYALGVISVLGTDLHACDECGIKNITLVTETNLYVGRTALDQALQDVKGYVDNQVGACVPLAGSNAISGSLIPSTGNSIDIGSSTKNLKMLYTKGITIDGTQFLPSNYMTLNTSQTVTSLKNYSGYQIFDGFKLRIKSSAQEKGVIPASNQWNGFVFCDKNNEYMFSIEQGMMPDGVIQLNFAGRANDNNTTYTNFLRYINNSDLTINCVNVIDLMPFGNGTRKLGDTNAKWKSFNGINPGALSLPGTFVNVDTTNWVLDGSNVNIFTPAIDGWLGIQATDTVYDQMHYVFVGRNDNASYHSQNVLSPINALWSGTYHGCVFIPVIKNVRYDIRCICSSIIATFYPCQGNV